MDEQYLRQIAAELTKLNSKLEKLIISLTESRDKLLNPPKDTTKQIGSAGDFNGDKTHSQK